MKFRETTQEDIDYVKDHSISRGILDKQPERTDFCYTLEHEGKVLGIGGFRFITLTTAWCWLDVSDQNQQYWPESYPIMKEWIDIFVKEHNIKRLQAYIECDFEKAIRMVKQLGFEKESLMKNFVDDKDAFMYVRLI